MNGWLGQVSLRLAERGHTLSGFRAPAQQRQLGVFLGQTPLRPSYELGRPVHHLSQEPKCCNTPDGRTLCFDKATGECQGTWDSDSNTPGAPSCVLDYQGNWTHPDCVKPRAQPTQMSGRVRQLPLLNLNFGPMLGRGPSMGMTANCCNKEYPDGTVWLECSNPLWRSPNADYRFPMCGAPGGSGTQPPVDGGAGGGGTTPGGGGTTPGGGGTTPGGGGTTPGGGGADWSGATPPSGNAKPPTVACPLGNFRYTLVTHDTGAVVAANITRNQFEFYTQDVTDLPEGRPCSDDWRCAPICGTPAPAPGDSGASTPPPTPGASCPAGQTKNYKNECVPGPFAACRNGDGSWRLFNQSTGEYYGNAANENANGVDFPTGVVASISDANGLYCQQHPSPTQPPVSAPSPQPTPGPIPTTGIPVLPPPQATTIASPPTGAWPGQPFAAAPRPQPVPIAKAPAPLPPTCPLGPVPLRRWVEGCMGS
jgi:hypothetical protein